ncbi:PulJ/GspJ family protein [Metabacillus bambusae]|uniref:Prepilin-type N-terminal cleavage/methylation domain-containing protein n=1 Tax=Metabacillus bambusae TaxID=2795218 RepID=A0ABS3N9M3_9BACI|nr:prepilin-type N-terminal cleavage/methylation domain-containing protein [Metabacillus bambusae]MBO1514751.1 prepilin-type N-terminal cleavage/methylation domain-containing protein [Metabacillus bambusae]
MQKSLKHQNGLTLIEVLATLAILSTLLVLIWGVLLNGFNYSKKAQETVLLQQEANLIVTKLTKIHQSYDSYTIMFNQNPIKVIFPDHKEEIISNPEFRYSFYDTSTGTDQLLNQSIHLSDTLSFKLVISPTDNPELKYEIRTTLSKLDVN